MFGMPWTTLLVLCRVLGAGCPKHWCQVSISCICVSRVAFMVHVLVISVLSSVGFSLGGSSTWFAMCHSPSWQNMVRLWILLLLLSLKLMLPFPVCTLPICSNVVDMLWSNAYLSGEIIVLVELGVWRATNSITWLLLSIVQIMPISIELHDVVGSLWSESWTYVATGTGVSSAL